VPCYNEERRLPVASFDAYLADHGDVDFVLVNDGSTDGTLVLLRSMAERWPGRVHVVDQQPNGGKAEAVRAGLREALSQRAEFIGYWDADLATPLDAIDEFVQVMRARPQVQLILGARVALLGRAIERRPLRHYLGRVFATAASLTLGLPVYDTQCGAKLLRVSERTPQLFEAPFLSRWIFDVELIARFLRAGNSATGLYELPLREWHDVGESKVKPRDFVRAILELWAIYRAYRAMGQRNSNA
jgi:glycosyltransferase involved in cell wall biosynthesis